VSGTEGYNCHVLPNTDDAEVAVPQDKDIAKDTEPHEEGKKVT
jgi:hypothetical protein